MRAYVGNVVTSMYRHLCCYSERQGHASDTRVETGLGRVARCIIVTRWHGVPCGAPPSARWWRCGGSVGRGRGAPRDPLQPYRFYSVP